MITTTKFRQGFSGWKPGKERRHGKPATPNYYIDLYPRRWRVYRENRVIAEGVCRWALIGKWQAYTAVARDYRGTL